MSSHIRSVATHLYPIPAVFYVHRRKFTGRKNNSKLAALKSNQSIAALLLQGFVRKNQEKDSTHEVSSVVTPPN